MTLKKEKYMKVQWELDPNPLISDLNTPVMSMLAFVIMLSL